MCYVWPSGRDMQIFYIMLPYHEFFIPTGEKYYYVGVLWTCSRSTCPLFLNLTIQYTIYSLNCLAGYFLYKMHLQLRFLMCSFFVCSIFCICPKTQCSIFTSKKSSQISRESICSPLSNRSWIGKINYEMTSDRGKAHSRSE